MEHEAAGQDELEKPKKNVLKISEMALFYNGKYFAEVGNPSYGTTPEMFTWYPGVGLSVKWGKKEGKINAIELAPDDLMRLPHGLGHVSFERLLSDKEAVMSDRRFERKVYDVYDDIKQKIWKIHYIADAIGQPFNNWDEGTFINKTAEFDPQYSPEELLDTFTSSLKNPEKWMGKESIGDAIQRTGILDPDPKKSREAIVSYFYLYCRLSGHDGSDPRSIKEALEHFRAYRELMDEFKRSPDARFGDALLSACSELTYNESETEE